MGGPFWKNKADRRWSISKGEYVPDEKIDRAEWFDLTTARRKLVRGQVPFLDALERELARR